MISYSEKSSLVNWTAFEVKSDSPERDFEALCRSLVRLAFSGDGEFVGYKQQSGVEFLITVDRENSTLGKPGSVVGWQCKYFKGKKLSSAQFDNISDSYHKTIRDYPQVSTWILWTPECLSKSDQDRIKNLRARTHTVKKILFWHGDMILALSAILPRATFLQSYFGQYSFSRKDLAEALEDSIVPVRGKWKKDVHCISKAEKLVRRALFEIKFWSDAWEIREKLKRLNTSLSSCKKVVGMLNLHKESRAFEKRYAEFLDSVEDGRLVDMKIKDIPAPFIEKIPDVFRRAYYKKYKASFLLQNLLYVAKQPAGVLEEMRDFLSEPLIAVKAPPGMGKTHLCISVVSPTEERPAGIFLLGRWLRKGRSLDEFVRSLSFAGRTFENIDVLLNALDSIGRKNGCIMPLVIDGLNEAESPEEWADNLALLSAKLKRNYPNVKVLVTFRSVETQPNEQIGYRRRLPDNKIVELDYENMCLPHGIKAIEIEPEDLREMAARYFKLYNINFKGIRLDLRSTIINHPLLLSIFCAANTGRVVMESDLQNAHNVFSEWIKVIESRVCGGSDRRGRHSKQEFEQAIDSFAYLLWEQGSRSVSADSLDDKMRCLDRDWLHKWSTILSDEGLAMIYHTYGLGRSFIEGIHDRVSGFLIARYLKLHSEDFHNIFMVAAAKKHPLLTDILAAAVPMWMETYPNEDIVAAVPKNILPWVIEYILRSEKSHCPLTTLKSLWDFNETEPSARNVKGEVLRASVWQCMEGSKAFNGESLEYYLNDMSMSERDVSWSVWVYEMSDPIYEQLKFIYVNRDKIGSDDVQSVFACCKWLFSSNVPPIRDLATKLMCALGEKYPNAVLNLIVESFGVNDLYILERLVAAAYGICIYLHGIESEGRSHELILNFANALTNKILKGNAESATSHYGVLNYAINTVALATGNKTRAVEVHANPFESSGIVSAEDLQKSTFATLGDIDFIYKDLAYIVGGHDYQTNTPEYRQVHELVQKRIFALGYRNDLFEQLDRNIRDEQYRMSRSGELFARRFGKKYASVAFMELKGYLDKKVTCWDRWHEVSIDPTFPEAPLEFPLSEATKLIKEKFINMRKWIFGGFVPNVVEFATRRNWQDLRTEFVLVDGYVTEEDNYGRRLFISMDGLLVPKDGIGLVKESCYDARIIHPHFYYSFHGESPWSLNWYTAEEGCEECRVVLSPELVRGGGFVNSRGEDIPVELLTVRYNWESYHSIQNDVGGALLSPNMAQSLGLKLVPHKWEYVDSDGQLAARYYDLRTDMRSIELFYVRKDLLVRYAKMRKLTFRIGYWGERQISYKQHDKYKDLYKKWKPGDDKFGGIIDP